MYTIGARVMAQWNDGSWYPGQITQIEGAQYCVQFDDGDVSWVQMHQLQPQGGPMAKGGMGGGGMYNVGMRVRNLFSDGNYYYGTVTQVGDGEVYVRFDDGDETWLAAHEIEPEGGPMMGKGPMGPMGKGPMGPMGKGPMGPMGGGMYAPGQRVQAQWTDGGWYGATITTVQGPNAFFVTFDDGYTATLGPHQLQPEGGMGMYSIGQRVEAIWGSSWYAATITDIGGDGRFFVTYDDGFTNWLTPDQIRPM